MKGKFNIFQRAMIVWNRVMPYNAVHVARVRGDLDPVRLERTVNEVLENTGLTGFVMDKKGVSFEYRGGPAAVRLRVLSRTAGPGSPETTLEEAIRLELNQVFPLEPAATPFRFFVLPAADSFYLGLSYCHPVSGADSVIRLMEEIISCYRGVRLASALSLWPRYPKRTRSVFFVWCRYWAGWLMDWPDQLRRVRSSCRPPYPEREASVDFLAFRLDAPATERLKRFSKHRGVTMNDLFLALILKALSPLCPERTLAKRRKDLSVASIVNVRKDLAGDDPGLFGVFLSYFSVAERVEDASALGPLAESIHRQTEKVKKRKLYLRTYAELAFSLLCMPFLTLEQKRKFYPKNYPIWAGLTNVNLSAQWHGGEEPLDYLRAVSTSPVCPLVFSATTANGCLSVGISWHSAVFTADQVRQVVIDFQREINSQELTNVQDGEISSHRSGAERNGSSERVRDHRSVTLQQP